MTSIIKRTGKYTGMTMPGYVETSEGILPYAEIGYNGGILHAPVCVQIRPRKAPAPARNAMGRLLYALPGGGRIAR